MRAVLMLGLIVGLLVCTGCATMTQTPAEVRADYGKNLEYSMRQLADDCNYVLMLDRPTRLSRWLIR